MPVTVLASFVLAGVAAPFFPRWAGPLAISQAKKPQPLEDTATETIHAQQKIPTRSKTTTPGSTRTRMAKESGRIASGPANGNLEGSSKLGRASSLRAKSPQSPRRQLERRTRPVRIPEYRNSVQFSLETGKSEFGALMTKKWDFTGNV